VDALTLNARVRAHLGDGGALHVIQRTYLAYVAADIAIAIKEFLAERGAEVFRFSGDPLGLLDGDGAPVRLIASPVLEQIEVPSGGSRQGIATDSPVSPTTGRRCLRTAAGSATRCSSTSSAFLVAM
jgi:hypothetical protein